MSFGNVSSPKRMSAKNPVMSSVWNNRSSCFVEDERSLRTVKRSLKVRALLRVMAEPLSRKQPFNVRLTRGECRDGRTLGKYGSSC